MVQALPVDSQEIVITASRAPQPQERTPASITIFDRERIERLGEPLIADLLRLAPSVSVAPSGPAGSLTDVRIRGAEANHTLLFIDGIRANDPAAGNIPRFELLNADLFSRVEVVRGPQSALWGSEAVGGVVSVGGGSDRQATLSALAETGSFGFRRSAAQAGTGGQSANLSAAVAWQRSGGIDSFGGGDRDGYRNLSGRLSGRAELSPGIAVGASGFALTARNDYDGFNPFTFVRSQDLEGRNRLRAGRLWAAFGSDGAPWRGSVSGTVLRSSNRNYFDGDLINRTAGRRSTLGAQAERRLRTGTIDHLFIAAVEHEQEKFSTRDAASFGLADQDRSRAHQSVTIEWRAALPGIVTDIAVRHDRFERFKDATTLRAGLLAGLTERLSVAASYGEGIAQPTFFDLYGFYPGSFVGNPALKPETSRGAEVSLRYRRRGIQASVTGFRQRLHDEIVDVFDTFPFTTRNRQETSRRSGVELDVGWTPSKALRLTANYAYLHATQPGDSGQLTELRRPKHSGSLALDGAANALRYGLSISYTGDRRDQREDYPYDRVRLSSYWLAGARLAYAVRPGVELFGRAANAFDDRHQDVFGYRTEGRSVHVGIRLAPRR